MKHEQKEFMNEQYIFEQAIEATSGILDLTVIRVASRRGIGGDAIVKLMLSNGQSEVFKVEILDDVKRLHTLHVLHEQTKKVAERVLLVAPYLSQTMANECRQLDLNFIDMAGNAHIDVPGCLVFISGNRPNKTNTPTKDHGALRTVNGLRIVFALLIQAELVRHTQREIAAQAGVALGSVGKVLEDLQRLGYLYADRATERRLLGVNELAHQWVQQYPITLRDKLNPRKYTAVSRPHWQDMQLSPGEAAWSGEFAADRIDGYLKPVEATIYSWRRREQFIVEHRLRPDPEGEIEILDAFWLPQNSTDTTLAPTLLVYADLMASRDGRVRESAARLWESMKYA